MTASTTEVSGGVPPRGSLRARPQEHQQTSSESQTPHYAQRAVAASTARVSLGHACCQRYGQPVLVQSGVICPVVSSSAHR